MSGGVAVEAWRGPSGARGRWGPPLPTGGNNYGQVPNSATSRVIGEICSPTNTTANRCRRVRGSHLIDAARLHAIAAFAAEIHRSQIDNATNPPGQMHSV
ncbi:MAG: hypothetical protein O2955_13470 [Planctomycetota bacterium]|nr:hypothetical protein [Planctomycetota bacterium]MDA1213519.1 hypothetical protein [Planctomycetota bacterium]